MTAKKTLPCGPRRAIGEWKGRTPNTKVPLQVQLRILERQAGKCAITGKRFGPKEAKRLDHIVPLSHGGENRESNLQWILADAHAIKTAQEAKARAKADRAKAAHHGLKKPKRPLESRNDLKADKPKREQLPLPRGLTPLQKQFGWKP